MKANSPRLSWRESRCVKLLLILPIGKNRLLLFKIMFHTIISAIEWTDWWFEKCKRGWFSTEMVSTVYAEDYTHKPFTVLLTFHANSFANCVLETFSDLFNLCLCVLRKREVDWKCGDPRTLLWNLNWGCPKDVCRFGHLLTFSL